MKLTALRAFSRMNPAALTLDLKHYVYGGDYLYPLGLALFAGKLVGLAQPSQVRRG